MSMAVRMISGARGRTIGRVAGLAVLGLGLFLGGCNKDVKAQNEQLMLENTQLRTQNEQLATTNSQLQTQMSAPSSGGEMSFSNGGGTRVSSPSRGETVIEIAGDVLFDSGKATLKSTAKKELDSVASTIRSRHSGRTIKVIGHTDSDPIRKSKWPSNEALSEARADAVADYLGTKGISRGSISTLGKGASEPKGSKSSSRRVEVVIVDG